jgi:hypothetical protein
MTEERIPARRVRLSGCANEPPLAPFVRATNLHPISLYWIPVAGFPIPFRQREWLLAFLEKLSAVLEETKGLQPETFLQLKYTRAELNRRFMQTLLEYEPVTGILLRPGEGMPQTPTSLEIKELVENPDANAEIRIEHLTPDYCGWFLQKKGGDQRNDFLGVGGMMLLWVANDEANAPAKLKIPRSIRTHPDFAKFDIDAQLRKLHSMQTPWLKQSKEIFGEPLREEGFFQGVPFILPRLDATDFMTATEEKLKEWFGVFGAYCIESEKDKGLLLAVGDPDFDETLQGILDEMRTEKLEFGLL